MIRYLLIFLVLFGLADPGGAAGSSAPAPPRLLPEPECGAGWTMDGQATRYDRDNLFERINGEAELYFPYGFDLLIAARYMRGTAPHAAFDAEVYQLGSPLDAFGMYVGYRHKDAAGVDIGVEGALSAAQCFFYQDRYLVKLQATGATPPGRDAFLACARAIARNLPRHAGRPHVLEALALPELVPRSERYIATSLLGYDFFRRGLMADVLSGGDTVQLFLVLEDSPSGASRALAQYLAYLQGSGQEPRVTELPDRTSLTGVDPLYGNVVVVRAGRYLIGAVRVKDGSAASRLVEQVRRRITGSEGK